MDVDNPSFNIKIYYWSLHTIIVNWCHTRHSEWSSSTNQQSQRSRFQDPGSWMPWTQHFSPNCKKFSPSYPSTRLWGWWFWWLMGKCSPRVWTWESLLRSSLLIWKKKMWPEQVSSCAKSPSNCKPLSKVSLSAECQSLWECMASASVEESTWLPLPTSGTALLIHNLLSRKLILVWLLTSVLCNFSPTVSEINPLLENSLLLGDILGLRKLCRLVLFQGFWLTNKSFKISFSKLLKSLRPKVQWAFMPSSKWLKDNLERKQQKV